jgi:hypothetical protein
MVENENIITMLGFAVCKWVVTWDCFAVAKRLLPTEAQRER